MKISGIDFPKSLLDALRDGRLVVFAGAGVSMGKPASLPSFKGLVKAISSGTGEVFQDPEQEDRFLGRLKDNGVRVHERAAQELSRDGPKPTDLHRDLLWLYSTPQSVRLVTTNFDRLFEQASEDIFDQMPDAFNAPALPLGTGFNGIVHVHGSFEQPGDMVLTDADFGRAYLTEGWARRFLVDLFRSFSTLFIGYSHNDVVMSYLARALPPNQTERFALTDADDGGPWRFLGIEPIIYPKASGDDYSGLYKGVDGLSKYARRGILDWQHEITEIAKTPPSLNEEAMDIINDALSDPTRTRFFTDVASHTAWIWWLDQHNHLEGLFTTETPELGGRDRQLAWWLAKKFARGYPEDLFHLIGRKGTRIHPEFWFMLGQTMVSEKARHLDTYVLSRWVSLLLVTAPQSPDDHILSFLGERSAEAGLTNSCLDIFNAMTASSLRLQPSFDSPENDTGSSVTAELVQVCEHYNLLKELWDKRLKPSLEHVAESLLGSISLHFAARHRTLSAWQSANRILDSISFRRSAIEPHEQDKYPLATDVLIDAARDCLKYLAAQQPSAAAYWCDYLVKAEAMILRRLVIHILPVRQDLAPDRKARWLLTNIGLHDLSAHHEIFQAMRSIYPHTSPEVRQVIIDDVFSYVWPTKEDENRERFAAYHHFSWLQWLQEADPDCDLVKQSLGGLIERYPDFQPSEHPDLNIYITRLREETKSPWSVEELVALPAANWVSDLLSFQKGTVLGPSRHGLMQRIQEAATQKFEWGIALADALAESGHWDVDLWPCLMRAWSRELNEDKHRDVLGKLTRIDLYPEHIRAVADVLHTIVKDGGVSYAPSLLTEANEIADTLWGYLESNELLLETDDWLMQAINHPAGVLTQFWLSSLSLWRNRQDPRADSLNDEYHTAFSRIVKDKTLTGSLGKAVLGSQLTFIWVADENWANEHLIPLFEHASKDDYRAVWHGFLYYGHLSPEVANALENAFSKAVPCIEDLFPSGGRLRPRFVEFYAAMTGYFVEDPLGLWIIRFFENANEEDRRGFAWNISHYLNAMDDAKQREWWERWLRQYWQKRLQGVPAPLEVGEIDAMLGWLPRFKGLVPEAVDLAVKMPQTLLEQNWVVSELNEGELWSRYPEAVAKLLVHIGGCESPSWIWHDGKELIEKLLPLNLPQHLEIQLKELSVKLGFGTNVT